MDSPPARTRPLVILLLFAVVAGVFGPSLAGGFVWDDEPLIRDNQYAHSWAALSRNLTGDFFDTTAPNANQPSGYYRPVVKVAFVAQWVLGGGKPWLFHAVNLLLHLACCLLVFEWLRRRVAPGTTGFAASVAAAAGALLFALHPSRPESVSWISGSTDLWMTLFVLLGFTAWERLTGLRRVVCTALAFAVALVCKEAAIVAPLVLLSDAWLLRNEDRSPALVTAALFFPVAVLRLVLVPVRSPPVLSFGFGDLFRRTFATLGLFTARTLAPVNPSVQVGALPQRADGSFLFPNWMLAVGAIVVVAAAAMLVQSIRRRAARAWLADALHLLIPLAPVLNVVPIRYHMLLSEHFLYWPLIGLAALLARGLAVALRRGAQLRRAALAGTGVVILGCAFISSQHLPHLLDDESLWRSEYARDPDNAYVCEMLARTSWNGDRLNEARALAARALQKAVVPEERTRDAVLYAEITSDAISDHDREGRRSVQSLLDRLSTPDLREVVVPLGAEDIRVELDPRRLSRLVSDRTFLVRRAVAHARAMDPAGAEALFRDILARFPDDPSAWTNLATLLATEERWEDAASILQQGAARVGEVPEVRQLHERLNQLRAGIAAAPDAVSRSVAWAEALISLGAPERARAALDAVGPTPATLLARAHVAVAEQSFDEADGVVAMGERQDPAHAADWSELRAELADAESSR